MFGLLLPDGAEGQPLPPPQPPPPPAAAEPVAPATPPSPTQPEGYRPATTTPPETTSTTWATVYLVDGSSVTGRLTEFVPGSHLVLIIVNMPLRIEAAQMMQLVVRPAGVSGYGAPGGQLASPTPTAPPNPAQLGRRFFLNVGAGYHERINNSFSGDIRSVAGLSLAVGIRRNWKRFVGYQARLRLVIGVDTWGSSGAAIGIHINSTIRFGPFGRRTGLFIGFGGGLTSAPGSRAWGALVGIHEFGLQFGRRRDWEFGIQGGIGPAFGGGFSWFVGGGVTYAFGVRAPSASPSAPLSP